MNLWNLYVDPTQINGYNERLVMAPEFAFYQLTSGKLGQQNIKIAEETVSKSAEYSYLYARYYLKRKRFPAGEGAIARSENFAYQYAKNVIRRSFPKGEKTISKSGYFSAMYANDVLKDKFPLGEAAINTEDRYKAIYQHFIKKIVIY